MGILLRILELAPWVAVLRLIRIGLRGLVMSLYYGDSGVLERLGYRVSVYTDDLKRS
jgi:hypothetical protein